VALERAAERFETIRRWSFYVSGLSGILTVPAAMALGAIGLVVAALAAGGALASVVAWRRMVLDVLGHQVGDSRLIGGLASEGAVAASSVVEVEPGGKGVGRLRSSLLVKTCR
jgi:hypothetical protein